MTERALGLVDEEFDEDEWKTTFRLELRNYEFHRVHVQPQFQKIEFLLRLTDEAMERKAKHVCFFSFSFLFLFFDC